MAKKELNRVAIVGAGYMGGGIAQVFALAGHTVTLADRDWETARAAVARLTSEVERFESLGLMRAGSTETTAKNLGAAESIEHAVDGAEYVTEAVPEQPELKIETLRRISSVLAADAIIGTNTSAIPIADLADGVAAKDRFLGVHWMNPAPFIPGVELIAGPETSDSTMVTAEVLIRSLGKITARVADTPGFVANRLQFALYKEATMIVEEGTASPEQIDAVVSNAFGFRLALFGPFAIGDMAGLDVYHSSYVSLSKAFGDRFAPPRRLTELVESGNLGIKAGSGFLDIPPSEMADLLAYRDEAYSRLLALRAELGSAPGLSNNG